MPSPPLTRSSDTPALTTGIGRETGIAIRSPICNRKRSFPRRTRASFGNRRTASLALGWKTTGRTTDCIKCGTRRFGAYDLARFLAAPSFGTVHYGYALPLAPGPGLLLFCGSIRASHRKNNVLGEVFFLRDHARPGETWFGHDVVIASLPIQETTLALAELDESLPVSGRHAGFPTSRIAPLCRLGWIPRYLVLWQKRPFPAFQLRQPRGTRARSLVRERR